MKYLTTLSLLSLLTIMTLCGCDRIWGIYWRSDGYILMAVDSMWQMCLIFDYPEGSGCALVGPTVFAIGSNEKYIVVKQHPLKKDLSSPSERTKRKSFFVEKEFDNSITNFFIVERIESTEFSELKKGVRGPMGEEEFNILSEKLQLPPFKKVFGSLK